MPVNRQVNTEPATDGNAPGVTSVQPPTDSVAARADVAYLQEMSSALQDKLPSLMYSQHNAQFGNRSVVINNATHRAGAQLTTGLVLEEVLSDGIILRYQDKRFKLKALNSWVNL